MFRRNRFGITAAVLCHLLLAPALVTSQLLPSSSGGKSVEVLIKAREQEKSGDVYQLRGEAEVEYRNLVLRADEATYNDSTGEVRASGHLTLDGGPYDEHIVASHGVYNVWNQTGKFYDVIGTSGARFHGASVTLTSTNPFAFAGRMVEQTGPQSYVVHHGRVTSCELPHPKWTINGERIVVQLGGKARAYNSTFRIEKVPMFYLPYADHPAEQLGRESGFLMPNVGNSTLKGLILGDAFYWAINRSMDTTLGAEYFSQRGWAQHGDWRFRPTEDSYISAQYYGVIDRENEGGEDASLNGEAKFPWGFRGVLSAEYLSSYLFRLAWGQTFSQAVNSEVKSAGFFSKNADGFGINFITARYQNFQSPTTGDVVTILHTPSFELTSVEHRIARTPVYWSVEGAVEALSRSEPDCAQGSPPSTCLLIGGAPVLSPYATDTAGRFDIAPHASLPLRLHGWTVRPDFGLRETYYTERQVPSSDRVLPFVPVEQNVNRRAAEASIEIRPPSLVRIFERPVRGHKLKHVIEPRMVYRYVAGVDNFADIIRFDYRDILTDTNELEYAVVQRLYTKPMADRHCQEEKSQPASAVNSTRAQPSSRSTSCNTAHARELLSLELKQKYFFDPTFGGAFVNGARNVFTTTEEFTGVAFLTSPRRFTPVVSKLRLHPSNQTEFGWQLDYDTVKSRIDASTVYANYRLGDFFLGGTHTYFLTPGEIFVSPLSSQVSSPDRFNQFRITLGYGNLNKRGINAATTIGFDSNLNFVQYSAVQATYNWDCCGLSFEYRHYSLGSIRNENQYRVAFSLANIATFGNLKKQERIY